MTAFNKRQLSFIEHPENWRPTPPVNASSLILSDDPTLADAALSRYRDYLGHEFNQVVIDCRQQLHLDAIAALCGTVLAGGELMLLAPTKPSPMFRRLQHCWRAISNNSCNATSNRWPTLPSIEQQNITHAMQHSGHPHLLIADRGRGKSSCLGQAIALYLDRDDARRVLVTAPRKANAQVLLQHAANVQFVAWDKLLQSKKSDALLVIDEAAGIPLWAIESLCQQYQPWLLATTVNGYEGSGRGFAIHFKEWLLAQFPDTEQHQLTQPLRWPEDDPLERWLNDALLLSDASNAPTSMASDIYHASELDDATLKQAFNLLLQAHYQSSPNDLALLLDDPRQFVALHIQEQSVIGVAWLSIEGSIDTSLRTAIIEGRRRPKGNLLPQALGYFLQQPEALERRWCRVARVAVADTQRRRQIGSQLLRQASAWAKTQYCEAMGTSFGYSHELARFWQANGYSFARISLSLDRVSARHAVIMLQPLQDNDSLIQRLSSYGEAEVAWCVNGDLRALQNDPVVQAIVEGFKLGYLPLSSAQFALSQQPTLPPQWQQLLQQHPLPIAALKQLLSVDSRQAVADKVRYALR